MWNGLVFVLAHHECSPCLQWSLRGSESCKVALSCHFALGRLAFGEVQVASVRGVEQCKVVG